MSQRKGQIPVLLTHSDFKQKEIAKEFDVSTQTVSVLRKTLVLGKEIERLRGESVDAR